jgi:putative ABC transport system ATP-binding protein
VLDALATANADGQSVVMVTHDLKSARRGDRVIYLADGQIAGEVDLRTVSRLDPGEAREAGRGAPPTPAGGPNDASRTGASRTGASRTGGTASDTGEGAAAVEAARAEALRAFLAGMGW